MDKATEVEIELTKSVFQLQEQNLELITEIAELHHRIRGLEASVNNMVVQQAELRRYSGND